MAFADFFGAGGAAGGLHDGKRVFVGRDFVGDDALDFVPVPFDALDARQIARPVVLAFARFLGDDRVGGGAEHAARFALPFFAVKRPDGCLRLFKIGLEAADVLVQLQRDERAHAGLDAVQVVGRAVRFDRAHVPDVAEIMLQPARRARYVYERDRYARENDTLHQLAQRGGIAPFHALRGGAGELRRAQHERVGFGAVIFFVDDLREMPFAEADALAEHVAHAGLQHARGRFGKDGRIAHEGDGTAAIDARFQPAPEHRGGIAQIAVHRGGGGDGRLRQARRAADHLADIVDYAAANGQQAVVFAAVQRERYRADAALVRFRVRSIEQAHAVGNARTVQRVLRG